MHTISEIHAPVQTPWETAVATVANRAKAAVGEASHSRIDKAAQIVLTGGVLLNDDHSAVVASQTEPLKGWSVNGACPCPDFAHAPSHLCKHRIACHIQRRALELAEPPSPEPTPMDTIGQHAECQRLQHVADAQDAARWRAQAAAPALPEAPASVNVRVIIAGREVQVTLRDTDEARLLQRLAVVLAQYPVPDVSTPVVQATQASQPTPDGWCLVHAIQMRKNSNDRGSWFSHKHGDQWCRGKGK